MEELIINYPLTFQHRLAISFCRKGSEAECQCNKKVWDGNHYWKGCHTDSQLRLGGEYNAPSRLMEVLLYGKFALNYISCYAA